MNRPNVIFIIADDMGYGDLSCINNGISNTPNLDKLYKESRRMAQGYSASCVCAPARAGFLTGRYPHRTGCVCLNDVHALNRLDASETTIADIFKAGGYHTGLVGKWHCGLVKESRPESHGFTEVEAFHATNYGYWDWTIDENGTDIHHDGRYLTDYLSERAVKFIERNQDKPFFLHLAHYAPHRPLEAPQELIDKYMARGDLTEGQATVYAMIEIMDKGIGMLDETLERLGLKENTIVIFTSDNGPDIVEVGGISPVRFNCGLRGHKYTVHDGGIRVPFMVRWPEKLEPDSDCHELFHFVDALPTLAAACGVSIPASIKLDGQNKLSAWAGESDYVYGERYWQWNRYLPEHGCNAAMRDGDWKLVIPAREGCNVMTQLNMDMISGKVPMEITRPHRRELGPELAPLLFNIVDDPCEQNDLSQSYAHRTNEMYEKLNKWFMEVNGELDAIVAGRF